MNQTLIEYQDLLAKFQLAVGKKYGEDRGFAYDGPVNSSAWFSDTLNPKVVFLLKEAYGHDGDDVYPIMDRPERFNDSKTNLAISKLAYAIERISMLPDFEKIYSSDQNLFDLLDEVYDKLEVVVQENLKASFSNIAIVEIKKTSGESKSNDVEIRRHSQEFSMLLSEQIKLLKPNVIICGGQVVWDALTKDMSVFQTNTYESNEKGVCLVDNIIVVNSYHPSSSKFNWYDLMFDICQLQQ